MLGWGVAPTSGFHAKLSPGTMSKYTVRVNGQSRSVDVESDTPMLWVLRDALGLVGTKFGCGIGECGACTIHVDGVPKRACQTPVSSVGTASITTIEGLAPGGGALHPIQAAFHEHHALQCGFCTAGMIMSVRQLLKQNPNPTKSEIRHNLTGNICRCTGYTNIVRAVESLSPEAHRHD